MPTWVSGNSSPQTGHRSGHLYRPYAARWNSFHPLVDCRRRSRACNREPCVERFFRVDANRPVKPKIDFQDAAGYLSACARACRKRFSSLNRNNERSIAADLRPKTSQYTLRNPRPHINSMRVQIGVSATKFIAVQDSKFAARNFQIFGNLFAKTFYVLIEHTDCVRFGHLASIAARDI